MTNNTQQTAIDKVKELVDAILMVIQDLPIDDVNWDYWQQIKKELETYEGDKQ